MRVLAGTMVVLIALMQGAAAAERVYYIAADEVIWNYAPSAPRNPITGGLFTDQERLYIDNGPTRIGTNYIKAVYREYADGSFATPKARSADQSYLGILGPIIHAEVGDTITVHFKNNTRL